MPNPQLKPTAKSHSVFYNFLGLVLRVGSLVQGSSTMKVFSNYKICLTKLA